MVGEHKAWKRKAQSGEGADEKRGGDQIDSFFIPGGERARPTGRSPRAGEITQNKKD